MAGVHNENMNHPRIFFEVFMIKRTIFFTISAAFIIDRRFCSIMNYKMFTVRRIAYVSK